jgi:hypothetical protein
MRLQDHATHQMPLPLFAVQAAPRQSQPSTRPDARKRQDGASGAKQDTSNRALRPHHNHWGVFGSLEQPIGNQGPDEARWLDSERDVRGWLNERRQRK